MGNGFSRERDGSVVASPRSSTPSSPTTSSSHRLRKKDEDRTQGKTPQKVLVYQQTNSMTSLQKKKTSRVFMDRKCWFLGRFISRTLTESSLAKLRAHVRLNKGYKTKIKLTSEGLASGTKSAGLMKINRVPYEFTPVEDIKDVFTDQVFLNVLLCVYRLTDVQYEIVAYRFTDEAEARLFQLAYYDLVGRGYTGVIHGRKVGKSYTINGGQVSRSADPEVVYGRSISNWTMKERPSDPVIFLGRNEAKANGIYRNGVIYRRPSLNELMERQSPAHSSPHQSRAAARARSSSPVVLYQQSDYTTFKDVAVMALLEIDSDSHLRSRPFFNRHLTYYRDGTAQSDVSCQVCLPVPSGRAVVAPSPPNFVLETGSVQRHMDNLEKEVNYLRRMVTNNKNDVSRVYRNELPSDYSGVRSNGYYDNAESDNSLNSMSTIARTNLAGQIDTSVGAVRVRVDDFRGRLQKGRSPSKISERTEPGGEDTTAPSSYTSDVASVQLNSTHTEDTPTVTGMRQGRSKTAASLIRDRNDIMTTSLRRTYNRSVSPGSSSGVSRTEHVRSRSTESRLRNRRVYDDTGETDVASVRSAVVGAVVSRQSHQEESIHPSLRNRSRPDYFLAYPGNRQRANSASRYEIRRGRHW